jgi:protease I
VGDFNALVIPGGTVNADKLRTDRAAVAFVHDFVESGKPVGVICHGPWTLVEAGVVNGRTLTSYPSVRTDLRNAGANAVDEEVAIDGNLISSRTPDDLPAFVQPLSIGSPLHEWSVTTDVRDGFSGSSACRP